MAIPPEERLATLLGPTGGSLALAESCTGGLIAHRVTQVAGSSAYFECGVVSYSNRSKTKLLGVPAELLAEHGAVSEACARAMLEGLFAATSASLGAAVTGVAGPTGGSPEKPVGTVWVAWGAPGGVRTERLRFEGDRASVKAAAAEAVLERLVRAAEQGRVTRIRCFVAAELPDPVRDDLLALQRQLGGRGLDARWAGRHALHLTLKFLGEIEPERFQQVTEALTAPLGIGGPLSLRPAGLGAFPSAARARVIWVGLAGDTAALVRGALEVEARLEPLGVPRETRPLRPHLTLGRARAPSGVPGAGEVLEAYRDYEGPPFRVTGLVLYESRLLPGGPRHTARLTIPLD